MLIDLIWILASVCMFVAKSLSHSGMETIIWAIGAFYGLINWYDRWLIQNGTYDEVETSLEQLKREKK
jgi:hypothetical protein